MNADRKKSSTISVPFKIRTRIDADRKNWWLKNTHDNQNQPFMKIIKRKTESTLMGSPVLMLANWKTGQEILDRESGIVEKYQPGYIYCAVDATDLLTIQQLEGSGFRFSEFSKIISSIC